MRKLPSAALLVAAGIVLAACGSGSSGGHGSSMGSMNSDGAEQNAPIVSGARKVIVTAKAYSFDPETIQIGAGEAVTFVVTSTDLPHDITVESAGHIVHAGAGKTKSGGLKITKPGTYTFYCSVTGHRAEGMTGKLIVS